MKASRVIDICTKAIPETGGWPSPGEPYGANDLVSADASVRRVLFCVTPNAEIVEHMEAGGYDLLVSHHPFHEEVPQMIFHTALDCCVDGNNDMWRDALGLQDATHFDANLGWSGAIDPISFAALCAKTEKFMGYPIIGQKFGPDLIRSVTICTGLGGLVAHTALASGTDCYILGEATQDLKEMGFKSAIETGHTHSEWIGVLLFKKLLESHGVTVDSAPIGMDRFGHEIRGGKP